MNSTSKPTVTQVLRRVWHALVNPHALPALATAALMAGCIVQGPWDYTPKDAPEFKGITTSAYIVADRPLTNICFEQLLNLDEGRTDAFSWYDSAEVGISGRFSDGGKTLLLKPVGLMPNCFYGDSLAKGVRGEEYELKARFVWDSAGKSHITELKATTQIPDTFKISRTAMVPKVAFSGGFGGSIFSSENFLSLPIEIRTQLQTDFPKELDELNDIISKPGANGKPDSVALASFFTKNGKRISSRVLQLVQDDLQSYKEGDTAKLYYISNTELNTTSHFFSSIRSSNIKSVLITQRFEKTASRIVTAFDGILGFEPESSSFYYPGDIRRLLLYPDAPRGNGGGNLLDTLGVINTWYFTGKNRLYFYGFDSTYYQYNSTTTLDDNPKLKPRGNVTGGRGFFSAAVVDSFDVMITGDPADKQYPLTLTQGLSCGEDGWFDNLDCRDYYQSYCELKEWNVKRCGASAIMTCAEKNEDTAVFKGLCKTGGIADSVRKIPGVEYDARIRYCTDNNFPAEKSFCEPIKKECEAGSGVNQCKTILWQMCEQRSWQPEVCKDARITYCRDSVKPAVAACKGVKTK